MITRYSTNGFFLAEGKSFQNESPEIVIDFLNCRNIVYHQVSPVNLEIAHSKNLLWLRIKKEQFLSFPMRRSFFEKLLMWYKIPLTFAYTADIDVLIKIMNNILRLIKRSYVRVVIEDGEALTITSPDYFDIQDLKIIERHDKDRLLKISRTDMVTKIDLIESKFFQPLPNDHCGIGLSLINSETGFRSYETKVYIQRYVCSNGAVLNIDLVNKKIPHYGRNSESKQVLKSYGLQIEKLNKEFALVKAKIENTAVNRLKVEIAKKAIERIDFVLGYRKGSYFIGDLKSNKIATQFDLFNFITDKAKGYEPNIRLKLEEIAGEIILN